MFRATALAIGLLTSAALAGVVVPLAAGAASFYGEIVTSEVAIVVPQDVRAQRDSPTDCDPFAVNWGPEIVGDGLGEGLLGRAPAPQELHYRHLFVPGASGGVVESATLYVQIWDQLDIPLEWHGIEVEGSLWSEGSVSLNLWTFDVEASLLDDNVPDVVIRTERVTDWFGRTYIGDFHVLTSALKVKYPTTGSPVPEPHAALVFAVGAAIVGVALHRARRRPAS
jgi:hypothetical protein